MALSVQESVAVRQTVNVICLLEYVMGTVLMDGPILPCVRQVSGCSVIHIQASSGISCV